MVGSWMPSEENPSLSVKNETQEMLLRLGLSQVVANKIVNDQEIDSPWTLVSLSDEDLTTIFDVIRRLGGLVVGRMPDREMKFLYWQQ